MSSPLLLGTDQIYCYNESGDEVPCADTGQDAECARIQPEHGKRFNVQGDIVKDRATGLIWSRHGNPGTFPMTWAESIEYTQKLNQVKHKCIDNWRLPSRRELFSLISHQHINPTLPDDHPYIDVFPGYYWTASSCKRLRDQAWYIHLGGGRIYRGMKYGSYMVWPVAGSQADSKVFLNRFNILRNTAYDQLSKLSWLIPRGDMQRPVKWEDSFIIINGLNTQKAGGYADWRLPNIRELESLVDLNSYSPALAANHPFEPVAEGYWSSTTSVYEPRYAWVLYPQDGAVGVGYKPLPEFHVWAVRSETHSVKVK